MENIAHGHSLNGTVISMGSKVHGPFSGLWDPVLMQLAFMNILRQVTRPFQPHPQAFLSCPLTCLSSSVPPRLFFLEGLSAETIYSAFQPGPFRFCPCTLPTQRVVATGLARASG